MISVWLALVVTALAVVAGMAVARWAGHRRAAALVARVEGLAEAVRQAGRSEAAAVRRAAEVKGREEALMAGTAFEAVAHLAETELSARQAEQHNRQRSIERQNADVVAGRRRLEDRRARVRADEEESRRVHREVGELERQRFTILQERAGETAAQARATIVEGEVEDARRAAALLAKSLDAMASDSESTRRAKRVMGIAVGRFSGHYLTERLLSTVPAPPELPFEKLLGGPDEPNLRAIEQIAHIKLSATETGDGVRLEGLDGVGREIARRALTWIARHPDKAQPPAVEAAAREIAERLDRELLSLGRRAFASLEIPEAHKEIVGLVGRLNYRTSYTQNQWKHAVEAAFLCGMMADELSLDLKIARRAALMHDIGKALTHELDGSHAVIGADFARRLGESEIVANAIGAHHTDEPFSSPYAYLVAAADAMSGARPGARRQAHMEESYVSRLQDLQRISRSFAGVGEVYAVQGGREVRVHVDESKIDDLAAVNLSSDIARRISSEMTFPGQIRVTVIRELKIVEVAG